MEIKEAICRITVITILFIALVVNKHSAAFLAGGREKSNQATKICNVYKFTKMPHKNVLRVSNFNNVADGKTKASQKLDSATYDVGINLDFLELRIQCLGQLKSGKGILVQGKEIELNSTGARNFDIFFHVAYGFRGWGLICGRETERCTVSPASFEVLLIFPSFLRS